MLPMVRNTTEISIALGEELPAYFNKGEIERILQHAEGDMKDHLLCNLLWNTGARVSEVLAIRIKDIDFYGRGIKLWTLKQRKKKQRGLPLQGHCLGELGAWIASKGLKRDDLLMDFTRQRAYQIVQEIVLAAGLDEERAHPHTFRHSFAVHCVLSGVPVIVLKEWLGHSSINNTLVYLKVLGSDTRHFYDSVQFA